MPRERKPAENGQGGAVTLIGLKVGPELLERLENACWHCRLTKKQVLEAGLLHTLEVLESKHNKGKPFGKPRGPKEIEL